MSLTAHVPAPARDLSILRLELGQARALSTVPELSFADFVARLDQLRADRGRVLSLFARPQAEGDGAQLFCVLLTGTGGSAGGWLALLRTRVGASYPSLTPAHPALHLFEREIYETTGILPEGHPWLKPVRQWRDQAEVLLRLEGEEVHEVAVGPVHAGVIEPGHFRFQCHGERVFNLEIALGYQHRGIVAALVGGPHKATVHQVEALAGDTTIGHGWAYAQVVEALAGITVSSRAEAIRAVALELERAANHIGDLGALAGDVGFLPTASYCGGQRGDLLNLTALICGSRLGRGLVRPGGVAFDLDPDRIAALQTGLHAVAVKAKQANGLLWTSPSVTGRFEGTGVVSMERARELGMVGVAGRASGVGADMRRDLPTQAYRAHPIRPWTKTEGDVYCRARVRWREFLASTAFIDVCLSTLPQGAAREPVPDLAPDAISVGLTEGWRGEICHVALTDAQGRFALYQVVDPSFHNWAGMEQALRGGEISDFPLCNKSFNLSYAGHDL